MKCITRQIKFCSHVALPLQHIPCLYEYLSRITGISATVELPAIVGVLRSSIDFKAAATFKARSSKPLLQVKSNVIRAAVIVLTFI